MKAPKRKSPAGFTLVEIMVATAISLILVLGVVQIATSSIRAYNIAMSTVSATAVSRQVLDTLESDIQTSLIKSDGNVWMECFNGKTGGGAPDPTMNSNFEPGACNTIIFFATPTDRDRFKPGSTGAAREPYKGEVCAVRYRLMNDMPLPTGLSSSDKAYCLYRVVVNPEDTFNLVLKKSADVTNTDTLPQILDSIKMDSGTSVSRSIRQNSTADIFGMNVVGMTPVFIFKRTDATKTPSSWYFYAAPKSPVNDSFFQQNLKEGFGSQQDPPPTFAVESFDILKISGNKYCITGSGKPSANDPKWKEGTLAAVLISLTVVDETGADEIRAAQARTSAGKISDDEWNRIIREHGHSFTRRINILGN
jgi:prepilin-type N-terminal cleavage/methylation domain-containing protein